MSNQAKRLIRGFTKCQKYARINIYRLTTMPKRKTKNIILGILAIFGLLFLFPKIVKAENFHSPELKIFNTENNELINNFLAFDENFKGGFSVAVGDLDGDAVDEIVVGAGPDGGPMVRIFDQYGNTKFTPGFFAYDENMKKGVNIAVGDLDGDSHAEIITAPKFGGAPQVRIFDRYGNARFTPGFYAYAEDFRGGVNLTIGDIDGGGLKEIITAPGPGGGPHIRAFNRFGYSLNYDYFPFHPDFKGGVKIATANVDGGVEDEIVLAVENYDSAWIKVIKNNTDHTLLGHFLGFPEDFKGGANVTGTDIDQDGFDEILVSVNSSGGPQIRAFEAYGEPKYINFFAYEEDFRGGVNISAGDVNNDGRDEIITAPSVRIAEGRTDLRKYIEVDISEQKLQYFENGYKLGEYPVSSGKISMPTPLGEFKIMSKAKTAYSRKYALYMPFWMQFTSAGHGLHGLPYWIYKDGAIVYEGENHLGIRVSHGCVRLPVAAAEEVFAWAEVGTLIIIHD